jgi:hypothetical protein
MRDIGFFTPEQHSFYLYYLTRIPHPDDYAVTVYTTATIHDDIAPLYTELEYDSIDWVIKGEQESIDSFFERIEHDAELNQDILWTVLAWGTKRVPANFIDFDPDIPSICGLVNLNDWTYNPFPDWVYTLVKYGTSLMRDSVTSHVINPVLSHLRYLMQPAILRNFDAVHMEYPPMSRFLANENDWEIDVYNLYPVVHEQEKLPPVSKKEARRIAIPGRISQNVRNITQALTAMERVFEHYDGDLILDFVGRPADVYESALERIETLQNQGYDVRYREEWIPYDEFAAALRAADIIINPLHVRRTISHPFRADMWTGRTNGTGIIFDALRYARPLVVPELFSVDERLKPFTETYNNIDHLVKTVIELLENEDRLADLQSRADAAAAEVTPEAQRPKFENIVDNILQSKHDNNIE